MAKKTKVQIAVETTGSKKAAKEMESIGRQQTRLGQASASAGRQFSAQASGLGGLVSAYAGAAATIFALSAAFDALNRAARAEQTLAGVNALASAVGESGPEVLDMIQRITKGQLSLVQSAELANLALSSGFSTEQLEGFTDVAMRASRALGRDLTDSFQRLVRGAVKLEPELLDELGIFTRIEPAAEAYAASVGKVASQLSRFEKRQAFANAVSEEGARKYKDIDVEADTAAQSLEKLAATVSNLATNIGGIIARALAPLAEALTSPIAAIGVMGVLIKTVFGTALREATTKISGFNAGVRSFADNVQDSIGSQKRAAVANAQFVEGLKGVNLNVARVSAANEQEFKTLTQKARAQEITTAETRRYDAILRQEIKSLKQEQKALQNSGMAAKALAREDGRLTRRIAQLEQAQAAANTRLNAFGFIARNAGRAAIGLGRAIGFAGKIALGALSWLSLIISYLSMIVAIGSTVLDAFGWLDPVVEKIGAAVRFFKELLNVTKEATQAKDAFDALDTGIEADAKFEAKSRINPVIVEAAEKTIGEKRRKIAVHQERLLYEELNSMQKRNINNRIVQIEREIIKTQRGLASYSKKLTIDKSDIESALKTVVTAAQGSGFASADAFVEAMAEQLKVNLDTNPELRAALEKLAPKFAERTSGSLRGQQLFAEAGGMTLKAAEKVLETSKGELRVKNEILENEDLALQRLGAKFHSQQEFNKKSKEERELMDKKDKAQLSILQSQQLQVNFLEALRSGTATIEQLEQKRGAILAKINKLKKEGNFESTKTAFLLEQDLDNLNRNAEVQLAILRTRKQIRETFSAQIKAASDLSKMNILNEKGEFRIATSKKEQSAAQLVALQRAFTEGKKFLDVERGRLDIGRDLTEVEKQRAALARDAELAIVGQFQAIVEQSDKLKDSLDKQTLSYKNQITLLKQQNALQAADRALKLSEQALKTEQKTLSNSLKRLDVEKALAKAKAEGADLDRQARNQRATDIAEEFGDLLSPQKQRALELRIARDDLAALAKSIEAQKETIRERAKLEKASLERQKKELQNQLFSQSPMDQSGGLIAKRFAAQKKLDDAKIASDKATRELQIEQTKAQVKLLDEQLNGFKNHVEGLARILAADRIERQLMLEGEDKFTGFEHFDFGSRRRTVEEERKFRMDQQMGGVSKEIEDIMGALGSRRGGLIQLLTNIKNQSNEIARLQEENVGGKRNAAQADARLKAQEALNDIIQKITNNTTITATELQKLDNELKEAGLSTSNLAAKFRDADNEMLQIAKDVASSLSGGVAQGLRDLNEAMIEGTLTMENFKQGFKDTFLNIAKDIQGKIFDRMVVKPVENFINEEVLGLFGFGPEKKIENALTPDGTAMRVVMGASPTGITDPVQKLKNSCDDAALDVDKLGTSTDTGGNFLEQMFSKVGTVLGDFGNALLDAGKGVFDFVGSLFQGLGSLGGGSGGGGFFSTILGFGKSIIGGVGDFFSGIFGGGGGSAMGAGIVGLTAASGGSVRQMAAGGMLRDRVPAMLEPGEFVVRKPMAKVIGGPALNAMNAHGTMPNSPNVVVNMNNQGTPQESEGKPNVQVTPEAIIVDIVTRDMQNNGPIRRSIRGNLS